MMSVAEIKEWLETLPNDSEVGVDGGGLCLRVVGLEDAAWLEIGGLPKGECHNGP